MKPKPHAAHVQERWTLWVRTTLAAAAGRRGLKDEYALINEVAASLATDPDDRATWPRSDVKAWLEGKKYISPRRAFAVGQKLGEVNGVEPKPGGLTALLSAGHFNEAVAVAYALLVGEQTSEAEGYVEGAERANAAVLYAIRFVGNALATLPDVHELFHAPVGYAETARKTIGDAPIEALEGAWQRAQASPLIVNVRVDPKMMELDGPLPATLWAWAALAEIVAQYATVDRYRSAWRDHRKALADCLDLIHDSGEHSPLYVSRSLTSNRSSRPKRRKR